MNRPIRPFTLEDPASGKGLSCDASGVALAGVPLLTKTTTGFQPRPLHEVDLLLRAAYRAEFDIRPVARGLAIAAGALNAGDIERAMIASLHLRLPPLGEDATALLAKADELIGKYNYNPEEPRDWQGRWTTGVAELRRRKLKRPRLQQAIRTTIVGIRPPNSSRLSPTTGGITISSCRSTPSTSGPRDNRC